MSTCYRIDFGSTWNHNDGITLEQLLSSTRLVPSLNVKVEENSMFITTLNSESGGCWFYTNDDGVVNGFTRFGGNFDAAEEIISEIEELGDVRVISEYDDDWLTDEEKFEHMLVNLIDFFNDYFEIRKEAQEIHDHCMNARFLLEDGDFQGKWDEAQCGSYRSTEDNENYFFELLTGRNNDE